MEIIEEICLLGQRVAKNKKELDEDIKRLEHLFSLVKVEKERNEYIKFLISENFKTAIKNLYRIYTSSEFVDIDFNSYRIYISLKDIWNEIKPNDEYIQSQFVKDLKNIGIAVKNSTGYYSSKRINGTVQKRICIDYKMLDSLLKEID